MSKFPTFQSIHILKYSTESEQNKEIHRRSQNFRRSSAHFPTFPALFHKSWPRHHICQLPAVHGLPSGQDLGVPILSISHGNLLSFAIVYSISPWFCQCFRQNFAQWFYMVFPMVFTIFHHIWQCFAQGFTMVYPINYFVLNFISKPHVPRAYRLR